MKTLIFLSLFFFISCNKERNQIIINGNLSNLPDGKMYLYRDVFNNKIDSTYTKNGFFSIKYTLKENTDEPLYLGLDHLDEYGILRSFSFPTYAKYKGTGYNSQFFFSDSIISLNGNITDFKSKSFNLKEKVKLVLSPKISAGYQTNALFNTDGDLFTEITHDTYNKVKSKIKEYPNSFHLLYEINNNRNSFTPIQVKSLLNIFKGEIIKSDTFKFLSEYNSKRFEKNKISLPKLLDNNGRKVEILNLKYKKHLVIFWASWCGPCREEIPSLKKVYELYKNDVEFISISIDEKDKAWQKALLKENMPWNQLIINENSKDYEKLEIFFQVSNSIPYVVLIDSNMKVLKSTVGLMTERELEEFLNK